MARFSVVHCSYPPERVSSFNIFMDPHLSPWYLLRDNHHPPLEQYGWHVYWSLVYCHTYKILCHTDLLLYPYVGIWWFQIWCYKPYLIHQIPSKSCADYCALLYRIHLKVTTGVFLGIICLLYPPPPSPLALFVRGRLYKAGKIFFRSIWYTLPIDIVSPGLSRSSMLIPDLQ